MGGVEEVGGWALWADRRLDHNPDHKASESIDRSPLS